CFLPPSQNRSSRRRSKPASPAERAEFASRVAAVELKKTGAESSRFYFHGTRLMRMTVRMGMRVWLRFVLFRVLVLLGFFLVDLRSAKAASRGQMANVVHDLPHLVVFKNAFPSRHAGGADAVLNDPLQLAVGVILNVFRG